MRPGAQGCGFARQGPKQSMLQDDNLDRADWLRIKEALSHFRHNAEFKATYDKVSAFIDKDPKPDG